MASERTVKIKFTGESKGVKKAAKEAEDAVSGFGSKITRALQNATDKLPGLLSGAISALPPQGQAIALVIVAGLAAALAPLLAAAITTALLLALGGGVLALGIKAAIDDPRVAKAFDALKEKAKKIFKDFAAPFVEPLVRAAKTFAEVLDDLRPYIDRLGAVIAPVIDKLAPALASFFKEVMPGIEAAVTASVPLFETLAEHLPKIGKAIGTFFEKISENGDDANLFFSDLLTLIEKMIVAFGTVIAWLASFYSDIRARITGIKQQFLELKVYVINLLGDLLDAAVTAFGWIPGLGPKLKTAQAKFTTFRTHANKELQAIKDKEVRVTVWSNVAGVATDLGKLLASLTGGSVSGKRASGGPVSAGQSYLVGERGPEILTMGGSSGNVTPNSALGPETLNLTLDLGQGIQQVVSVNLREQNRALKRRTTAATGGTA